MATPSFDELYTNFQAEAQDRRPDLTFDEGDISEMLGYGAGAMVDHVAAYFARRIAATYLDGASGDDLTTLADDHWNIQRYGPTTAKGVVAFTRAGDSTFGEGTIPAGTVVATQKDVLGREVQVTTDADVNYAADDFGDQFVNVTAVLDGSAGNVAVLGIIVIKSNLFDPTLTVQNAEAIAGGNDAETDDQLRDRVRNFAATVRRGTRAALEYGAKNNTGAAYATAVEDSTGIVSVYVSDSSGGSNQIMIDAVTAELENWRSAGVLVQVFGGSVYNIAISITLTVRPGVSTAALAAKVQLALVGAVNKLKIGETLFPDAIRTAAKNVDYDGIASVTVNSPTLGVTPLATQLIRTSVGAVTVS